MREIVHRATFDKKKNVKAIDIYYFTPEGNKLRSMPDVSKYLSERKGHGLTTENFTFARERVFRDPFEKERGARPRLGEGVDSPSLSSGCDDSPVRSSQSPVVKSSQSPVVKSSQSPVVKSSQSAVVKSSKPPSVKIKLSIVKKDKKSSNAESADCDKDIISKLPPRSARKLKRSYSELDRGEPLEELDSFTEPSSKKKENTSKTYSKSSEKEKFVTSLVLSNERVTSDTEKDASQQASPISSATEKDKRSRRVSSKLKEHDGSVLEGEESSAKKSKQTSQDASNPPKRKPKIKVTPRKGDKETKGLDTSKRRGR